MGITSKFRTLIGGLYQPYSADPHTGFPIPSRMFTVPFAVWLGIGTPGMLFRGYWTSWGYPSGYKMGENNAILFWSVLGYKVNIAKSKLLELATPLPSQSWAQLGLHIQIVQSHLTYLWIKIGCRPDSIYGLNYPPHYKIFRRSEKVGSSTSLLSWKVSLD